MKTNSLSVNARSNAGTLVLIVGAIFLAVSALQGGNRALRTNAVRKASPDANPGSGTLNPTLGTSVTWTGTATGGSASGEAGCVEGQNCDTYLLTLTGAPANWAGKKVTVSLNWLNPADDYDLYVHKDSNSGVIVANSGGSVPPEVGSFEPSATGTGPYTVHAVYFTVPAPQVTGQYTGTATVEAGAPPTATPPPAPQDTGPKIGYEIFQPPGTLVNVTSSSQGPSVATVEYLGRDAGEPSVGVNFNSTQDPVKGVTAFQADLQTVFAKFDDSCPANGLSAIWYNSQAPTSQVANQDPIGFTDRVTGRTFAGQLTLLSPTCKLSFTDTDGKDPLGNTGPQGWGPTTGPLGSGIDHQTVAGGPYHSPLINPPAPAYPHAVYYASQDLVAAFALRSDDGGATFGPVLPMYTSECVGLHGHLKVTPKTPATTVNGQAGTVFLPNGGCSGLGAVVVSENNGITWTVRPVPQTAANTSFQDPAVGIDDNGRVYFAMSSLVPGPTGDSQMLVATSDDNGQSWQNIFDVSTVLGLKNMAYPAAVAGTAGRAAVAFFGSTTGGDFTLPSFTGIWHLYVAQTFNGGTSWTITDATPNDPVQRGPIWAHGAADISRNLLDFFDITMDKEGRVQVGYPDGCVDGHCVQTVVTAKGNSYADRTTIARQSSGRRLLASFDPPNPLTATEAPGMPLVTVRRAGPVVGLSWSLGDTGNSPITGFQILRGIARGAETLLTTVPGNQTSFTDSSASDITQTYFYKVLAVNAVGASCGNNEVEAPYVGDTCTGLIVQKTPPNHPEQSAQGAAPQSLAIDFIAVAEPPATSNLVFKMKVTNMGATPPPNSRWRIVWNSYAAESYDPVAQQLFVGMRTDVNSVVTFQFGSLATAVVGLIVGVPTETERGLLPGSSFNADGTITLVIPKSLVGNPQPGDLLGAINGRTFTGDTPETRDLERSTALIDHTFVKAQRDNGHPAATYTVVGNTACPAGLIVPVSAVSRKTHGSAGDFVIDLPLVGSPGIECRSVGTTGTHQVVITFANLVTVNGNPQASVTSGTGTVSNVAVTGSTVTVDLTGVTNAQTITLTLFSVTDGTNSGNVAIPMGILAGDTNGNRVVNSTDISETKARSGQTAMPSTFRTDVTANGPINSSDIGLVQSKSGTSLP
ncbi:MAG: hypothetical protein ABJB49_05560 [Nitrospirota bacterium]